MKLNDLMELKGVTISKHDCGMVGTKRKYLYILKTPQGEYRIKKTDIKGLVDKGVKFDENE